MANLKTHRVSCILCLTLVFSFQTGLFTQFSSSTATSEQYLPQESSKYAVDIRDAVSCDAIYRHIEELSAMGSRVTGYPGCISAGRYVENILKDYGLDVKVHRYQVAVPLDINTSITILSPEHRVIKAYTLWPNSIQTSPIPSNGLSGDIIYVGKGELEDFDGKKVKDAIILMDFNGGDNWLNAARLGARAVIFIEPTATSYTECMKKFVDTPLYFPRLYVEGENVDLLLRAKKVEIFSRMLYTNTESENIIGIVNGTKFPDDIILVTAHYDSWSVVPALGYGSHEAISVATLLELAKYIKEQKPLRSVWFVAFSGHWQALAGAREFVEDHYFPGSELYSAQRRFWMQINLDLTTDGQSLQMLRGGHFSLFGHTDAGGTTLSFHNNWIRAVVWNKYLLDSSLVDIFKGSFGVEPRNYVLERLGRLLWWGTEPYSYMLDSEPAEMAGTSAFTLRTAYGYRQWRGVPLNDLDDVHVESLTPQLIITSFLVNSFSNEEDWGLKWEDVEPLRLSIYGFRAQATNAFAFIRLIGAVKVYNFSAGWYEPVPNAIVMVSLSSSIYPFAKMITFTDENGTYRLNGLTQFPMIPGGSYMASAWVINSENGDIEYAPDFGIYGAKAMNPLIVPASEPVHNIIVIMRCVPVTVFDVLDPKNARTPQMPDPRLSFNWIVTGSGGIIPQDFNLKGDFLRYGSYYNGYERLAMIFIEPRARFSIIFRTGAGAGVARVFWTATGGGGAFYGYPSLFLVNASEEKYEGYGFLAEDKPIRILLTAYEAAKDMYLVSNGRYGNLKAHFARSAGTEEKLSKVHEYLIKAEEYYESRNYSKAYAHALSALVTIRGVYNDEVMMLINDAANTAVLFFALIMLSTFFMERLFFHREGLRRIISLSILGFFLLVIFSQVHPSLSLMNNAYMGLIGVFTVVLFVYTFGVIMGEANRLAKAISYKILGVHEASKNIVDQVSTYASMSVESMRRHRLLSGLTLLTVVMMVTALTSLTSTSYYTSVSLAPTGYAANYDGIIVKIGRKIPPNGPLDPSILDYLNAIIGDKGIILPRIWYYPQASDKQKGLFTSITSEKNSTDIVAAVGLTSEESMLMLQETQYEGRYFMEDEYASCIIPQRVANVLHIKVGDVVEAFGLKMSVVGIYESKPLDSTMDLDGWPTAPLDPNYVGVLALDAARPTQAQKVIPSIPWDSAIILPYKLASSIGGYVSSVSVRFSKDVSFDDAKSILKDLATYCDADFYLGWKEKVFKASRIRSFLFIGWEFIPFVMAIGFLNVCITIISSVKEKIREVQTFSTCGCPPLGAATLILTESVVYSLLGVILGYFIGFAMNLLFIQFGIIPGFLFNYASTFVALSFVVIILGTLAASTYPAFSASRLVTPSLERKWKLPTKPRGDEWEIPLLMRAHRDEALGFLRYLREYYEGAGSVKGSHITKAVYLNLDEATLTVDLSLPPLELGVTQDANVTIVREKESETYHLRIYLRRKTGARDIWINSNYNFIDDLRKQILLWRALPAQEREKFINKN